MRPVHLGRPRRALRGGYLAPFVLLEPPAHNPGCCVIALTYSSGTFVSFFVYTAGCKASALDPVDPICTPLEPLEYTAESRDRTGSQHDIQCNEPAAVARGQKCGVKSLRTAGYAYSREICSLAIRLWGRRPEPEAL